MNSSINSTRQSSRANHIHALPKPLKHLECYQEFITPTTNPRDLETKNAKADAYLRASFQQAKHHECPLPDDPAELSQWLDAHLEDIGQRYKAYLEARKQGEPRQYFPTKAHALLFIQRVAPTKKVDGAWLYGALAHWQDERLHPLIHTYLDEIGNGISAQNHVSIFEKLMQQEGINPEATLPDDYYQQGVVQLALGYASPHYLPEVIGFNFGYEVLPLHLLISTYELRELGIDPFYFSLHLTIDNADCGHARQALATIESLLPQEEAERALFYQRLQNGYRLNDLGMSTLDIIQAINLEEAVYEILHHKAKYGQYAHSDYCQHGGKTVNEWLSNPDEIPKFIESLKRKNWIKMNHSPDESRFWHLIHGDNALMFGVFTPTEQQIIYDWIAGDWGSREQGKTKLTTPLFASQGGSCDSSGRSMNTALEGASQDREITPHPLTLDLRATAHFLPCWLRQAFEASNHARTMALLIPYLAAPLHTTPLGLMAAQKYRYLLNKLP